MISHEPVITITSHPDRCLAPATIRSAPKFSIDRAAMTSQNTGAAMTTSMTRPRLLDLFCGAGGAAMGYHRAGFDVIGVDIDPQPNYPFEFIQADALEILRRGVPPTPWWKSLSPMAIHASPPCQASCNLTKGTNKGREYPQLIPPTRSLLAHFPGPTVMENVQGSKLRRDLTLCGEMFGLAVIRHRYFEI